MAVINDKAKFAVEILLRYQHETGVLPRSTSDLSPLEEWLIIQMYQDKQQLVALLEEAFDAGCEYQSYVDEGDIGYFPDFEQWLQQKGIGGV